MNNELTRVNDNEQPVIENGLVNVNVDGTDMIMSLTSTKQVAYCSMEAKTPNEKKALYNMQNSPEKHLQDCINIPILVSEVYVEIVDLQDQNTGEIIKAPRIVILDDKGASYQCVSKGVFMCLQKIFSIFGEPSTWVDKTGKRVPLQLTVKQVKTNKGYTTLTLEL